MVEVENDVFGRSQKVARVIANPWARMKSKAEKDGIILEIVSAFRCVNKQREIIQKKIDNGEIVTEILKVSAAPGYSEHHSGRALDLTTAGCEALTEPFEKTDAFSWLQENALSFSFTLSYPKDNKHGIVYEPWHWRFS